MNLERLKNKDKSKRYLESLLEFIWVKIEEKYYTVAQGFRAFDLQQVRITICYKILERQNLNFRLLPSNRCIDSEDVFQ